MLGFRLRYKRSILGVKVRGLGLWLSFKNKNFGYENKTWLDLVLGYRYELKSWFTFMFRI